MVKSRKRINPRKTPTPKKKRNYAATDLTRVNLRAMKARLEDILMDLDALGARVRNLEANQRTPAPEPASAVES